MDICVCNPVTNKFTTFDIIIHTTDPAFNLQSSRTRRRYNDFCWLRRVLKKHHPLVECPVLPPKFKSSGRFDMQFLVQRMTDLETWLRCMLTERLYISDTAVHHFLQTTLTCKQIELYNNGQLSEDLVQESYRNSEYSGPALTRTENVDPTRDIERVDTIHSATMRPSASNQTRDDSGVADLGSSSEFDSLSLDSRGSSPAYRGSADSPGPYPAISLCESQTGDDSYGLANATIPKPEDDSSRKAEDGTGGLVNGIISNQDDTCKRMAEGGNCPLPNGTIPIFSHKVSDGVHGLTNGTIPKQENSSSHETRDVNGTDSSLGYTEHCSLKLNERVDHGLVFSIN